MLERAVDELPDAFRSVFMMRDIEDMSIEETADQLGIRPETVKTRLHRARRLLRKALDAQVASVLKDSFPFDGVRCARISERVMQRLAQEGHLSASWKAGNLSIGGPSNG
jgi:RNA polymerase sigma-70 factor (ECF subfamily)